ncbi:hypothetical protein BCM14_2180 [Jezberella montanilacus]|uniref:Uncharacterized protein n=1 Tax=Jezberella montanilacus TaxID=323426 RepID=A0A2T0XDP5_9BURK|nr:hypothetical protein BCM14_2180 [Jezberella montanilacus]
MKDFFYRVKLLQSNYFCLDHCNMALNPAPAMYKTLLDSLQVRHFVSTAKPANIA